MKVDKTKHWFQTLFRMSLTSPQTVTLIVNYKSLVCDIWSV